MESLLDSLLILLAALLAVIHSLAILLLPWIPLGAWIAFWMFGVNWTKLRAVLLQGAWIGVLLMGLVMVLVWGTVAPPPDGVHNILGLTVSNFVGKTVFVTVLFCIMFLSGAVQLSGCCASCCNFSDDPVDVDLNTTAH